MKLVQLIEFLRKRLKAVIWISYAVLALLVVLDALPFIVDKEHAHTKAEHWPAFWTMFGLLGCGVLVLISKLFGRSCVSRREDYYDE